MKNNRIIISGSNGFIGTHLTNRLRSQGAIVFPLPHNALYNLQSLEAIFRTIKPDYIFHLAGYGNHYYQDNEQEIVKANIIGLSNLLFVSKEIPLKGFINFSSSSVLLPYETFYSATKAGGERLCKAYYLKYIKPIVSVRPFSVTGKEEQPNHLIPTLIRSCLQSEEMSITNSPVHDFIDIRDFITGLLVIANDIEEYAGKSIGIGTGNQYTNKEVRKLVEKVTGKKANIKQKIDVKRVYDTDNWCATDNDFKIRNYSLEQTIQSMV